MPVNRREGLRGSSPNAYPGTMPSPSFTLSLTEICPSSLPEPPPSGHSPHPQEQAGPVFPVPTAILPQPEPLALTLEFKYNAARSQGRAGGDWSTLPEQSPAYYYNIYLRKPTLSLLSRQHLIKCVGLLAAPSSC